MDNHPPPVQAYLYDGTAGLWRPVDVSGMPAGGHTLYIAVRAGEPWFEESHACRALGLDPAQAAALLGQSDRIIGPVVTAGEGKRDIAFISEYGFHFLAVLAAGLARAAPACQFHRWVVKSLLPSVRKAAQPSGCVDPAEHVLADIVQQKLGQRRQSLAVMNCAKLLTYLWANHPDGQLLEARKLALAHILGINPRSLGRAMDCLLEWGFVESRQAPDSGAWPKAIRLNRAKVHAALGNPGLDLPQS